MLVYSVYQPQSSVELELGRGDSQTVQCED